MKIMRSLLVAACLFVFVVLGGAAIANDETKELSKTVEKQANDVIDISKLEFVETKSTPTLFESESAEKDLKVYKDSNNIKYRFKQIPKHGNVLCGIQKEKYYGTYVPGGEVIAEEKARQIAEIYLAEYIENFSEYTFDKLTYNECDAVFVINYYMPVQGFISDDQIVIYITWDGEVGAFSAFNRYHFENAPVLDTKVLQKNQESVLKKGTENFAEEYGYSSGSYTIDHSILSIRNGQYFVDQYVTVANAAGQQAGTVIPVPIT